jgi:hypothetical protein
MIFHSGNGQLSHGRIEPAGGTRFVPPRSGRIKLAWTN